MAVFLINVLGGEILLQNCSKIRFFDLCEKTALTIFLIFFKNVYINALHLNIYKKQVCLFVCWSPAFSLVDHPNVLKIGILVHFLTADVAMKPDFRFRPSIKFNPS